MALDVLATMTRVRYSRHARERMKERNVSEAEVEAVLADYQEEYPGHKGRRILVGYPNGRKIKVSVVEGSDPPIVVTVMD